MGNRNDSAVILAVFLAGCGTCGKKPAPDTGPVVISSAVPEAAAAPVDLLYATNAIVAVSSRVDNPRDVPDHLIDHREETAWNGRTGDLVGAWIAFRVPTDSHVDHILLSSGFDKVTAKEDLFVENQRVAKVRILRAGTLLKEAVLDTNERKPQKIDIDAAGGEFKIEIAAVVAGTKKDWREITVSELAVMGTPGKRLRAKPGAPLVRVGSLDVSAAIPFDHTAAATYQAACKAWITEDTQEGEEMNKGVPRQGDSDPDPGTCGSPATVTPGLGIIVESAHVPVTQMTRSFYLAQFEGDVLALRTASEVLLTNVRVAGSEHAIYWSVTYKVLSESWVGDQLVIDVEQFRVTDSDGYAPPGHEDELHSEVKTVMRTTCEAKTARCESVERK